MSIIRENFSPRSSHKIERETPDQKRAEKFIGLLEQARHRDFLSKTALVELQQSIVEPRFAHRGWRSELTDPGDRQVHVGETLGPGLERVHFAAPKPGDLEALMGEFLLVAWNMAANGFDLSDSGEVPPLPLRVSL